MIKKRRVRLLAFLTVMLLSMTIFSSVALADGSESLWKRPSLPLRPHLFQRL